MNTIVMKGKITALFLVGGLLVLGSCNKVKDGKVVEDSYSGNVNVTSTGTDPAGDFTGSGDNGTYAFGWENKSTKAEVNFDITTPTGSLNFILEDADKMKC
jgi:hypothetical protein